MLMFTAFFVNRKLGYCCLLSLTLSPCGGNFRDLFPFLSPMGLMPDNYTPTAEQQRMSPEFIGQATTGLDVT